jgi:hypothetical protein
VFPADAGKRWVLNGDPGFGGEFISDRLDWREQARGSTAATANCTGHIFGVLRRGFLIAMCPTPSLLGYTISPVPPLLDFSGGVPQAEKFDRPF